MSGAKCESGHRERERVFWGEYAAWQLRCGLDFSSSVGTLAKSLSMWPSSTCWPRYQVPNSIVVPQRAMLPGWMQTAESQEAGGRASWEVCQARQRRSGIEENAAEQQADSSSLMSPNTHGETEDQREKGTCSRSHYKSVQAAFLSAFDLGSWPGLPFILNEFASAHPSPSLGILCLSPLSVSCHPMAPHFLLFLPLPSNSHSLLCFPP